jgi:hypothetical protein
MHAFFLLSKMGKGIIVGNINSDMFTRPQSRKEKIGAKQAVRRGGKKRERPKLAETFSSPSDPEKVFPRTFFSVASSSLLRAGEECFN